MDIHNDLSMPHKGKIDIKHAFYFESDCLCI